MADDQDEQASDDEFDDPDDSTLVPLSEEAATFLEAAFNTKLGNKANRGKAKAQGTRDSRWIRCVKIDQVVFANVSPTARAAYRAASKIQQFWLDAANPLVIILEKAEEMDLPKEVIGGIQTALQLMGNANFLNSAARRQVLMTQLNPKLRQLFSGTNFKDAPTFLFGEKFGVLAKERLEASEALSPLTKELDGRAIPRSRGWLPVKQRPYRSREQGVAGLWQQNQEKAKELTRCNSDMQHKACYLLYVSKIIKSCFIYSCNKHTGTSLTGSDQHNEPVNRVPKIGWASGTLPGSAN